MMRKGPLAWMVDHGVAPNLMMVLFIVGGLMASLAIKKEVFPIYSCPMRSYVSAVRNSMVSIGSIIYVMF